MANFKYVTENRLTTEAEKEKTRKRKLIILIGGPIALALSVFTQSLPISAFSIFTLIIAIFAIRCDSTVLAGAQGENLAIAGLRQLSDEFLVLNQVDIPNKESRTGVNEADLVVCGPEGIFAIEVKHNNGMIYGNENSQEWSITKVSSSGNAYGKSMRNPIKQVKKIVWLIKEHLKSKGAKVWIQGMVIFTNPSASLLIEGNPSLPIMSLDDAISYIANFKNSHGAGVVAKATQEMIKLKTSNNKLIS